MTQASQNWENARGERTAILGMLLFVCSEAMFFAGLISAFLVFRVGQGAWPPAGQPRLPVFATGFNTACLLLSAAFLWRALKQARSNDQAGLLVSMVTCAFLGLAFLLLQGREWVHLMAFGLTPGSGVYGGLFYALVGTHALHVAGATVALGIVLTRVFRGSYGPGRDLGLRLFGIFWFFVVGIWPVLYGLVYLT